MSASNFFLAIGSLAIVGSVASAQSADVVTANDSQAVSANPVVAAFNPVPSAPTGSYSALLHDNGTIVTLPGAGFGGADASVINLPGGTLFGAGHQTINNNRVADDINVPAGKVWTLSDMTWYSYQTGSTTTSTMTGATVLVFSGPLPGFTVVAGDITTNRLTTTAWANAYRVQDAAANLLVANRPIMVNTIDMSWVPALPAGQYWISVSMSGSLASGPWAPPASPAPAAGNTRQAVTTVGAPYNPLADGTLTVEMPFQVNGTEADLPVAYCTAKVNSQGCSPAIAAAGTSSATATAGFVLSASNELNNKVGLVLYSEFGRDASAFGPGGLLCVKAPTRRSKGFNSGGTAPPTADCTGVFSIDFNTFAQGLLGTPPNPATYLLIPGQVVTAQFWGRDPGIPVPNNFSLSNGIEFTVGP